MEHTGVGLKHEDQQQQQQQQQQQPVAKRRHVVNVADASISEGGSSTTPIQGAAPGSSSNTSNWILIDDDNIDSVTWSRSDRYQLHVVICPAPFSQLPDRDALLTLGPDKLHVKGEKVGFVVLMLDA
jgi:hypothetical protein